MPKGTRKSGQNQYEAALKLARAKKPDLGKVYELLLKAEKHNNADATYALASWNLFGRHVARNPQKAVTLLKRAARRGSSDAAFDLAITYEKGEIVEKNDRKAFELFLTAALRCKDGAQRDTNYSFSEAAYEVARFYHYGIGIAVDRVLARLWMVEGKAARQSSRHHLHQGR